MSSDSKSRPTIGVRLRLLPTPLERRAAPSSQPLALAIAADVNATSVTTTTASKRSKCACARIVRSATLSKIVSRSA